MDEGKLHDRLGKEGDFSNALVVFTSNVGSEWLIEQINNGNMPATNQLMVTIAQNTDNNLYLWTKTSTMRKGGQILFRTNLGITVLRTNFSSTYCITLARDINTMTGTKTALVIAPEIVTMNGVEHDNFWPK
jgi:hypothetical protein